MTAKNEQIKKEGVEINEPFLEDEYEGDEYDEKYENKYESEYDLDYEDNSEKKFIIDIYDFKYFNPTVLLHQKKIIFSSEKNLITFLKNEFNGMYQFNLDLFLQEKIYKKKNILREIKLTILP